MDKMPTAIYAIADTASLGQPSLLDAVEQAILGGAGWVQYRDKTADHARRLREASALQRLCAEHSVPLIINDDVELARRCGAAGVHLGQQDTDPVIARRILGEQAIIGVSCYNQWPLAVNADAVGASYVAFGSVFASATKPQAPRASAQLLAQAKRQLNLPICAIGGINVDNIATLVELQIDLVAVIHSVFAQPDIFAATQALRAKCELNP